MKVDVKASISILGDAAGELELEQRRRQAPGLQTRLEEELIRGSRTFAQEGQDLLRDCPGGSGPARRSRQSLRADRAPGDARIRIDSQAQVFEQIPGRTDCPGTFAQELIGPGGEGSIDGSGNHEDLAPLGERMPNGDQRSAASPGLDHDDGPRQTADDAIAQGKMKRSRQRAERQLAHDRAALDHFLRQPTVLRGIDPVDSTSEHPDRGTARVESAAMGLGVDAAGETRDDRDPRAREIEGELASDPPSRAGRRASPDDRHRRIPQPIDLAAHREHQRGIVEIEQRVGVPGLEKRNDPYTEMLETLAMPRALEGNRTFEALEPRCRGAQRSALRENRLRGASGAQQRPGLLGVPRQLGLQLEPDLGLGGPEPTRRGFRRGGGDRSIDGDFRRKTPGAGRGAEQESPSGSTSQREASISRCVNVERDEPETKTGPCANGMGP